MKPGCNALCCARGLKKSGKAFSPRNQDGDRWRCPACRSWWIYDEDEAEGGAWFPAPEAMTEVCDCCGEVIGLSTATVTGKQILCPKCR